MVKTATGSGAQLASLALVALLGWWVPPAAAQTQQTKQVMRQKLTHSQQLLAALVTSNWASLSSHSQDLEALTNQPGWRPCGCPSSTSRRQLFSARSGRWPRPPNSAITHGTHRLQRTRGQLRGVSRLCGAVPKRDNEVSACQAIKLSSSA